MVASSILPVAIHKGKLFFLFGKENEMEDSAKGFSDFGGGVESGESITDTAIREGAEELCGFLGEPSEIKRLLKKNGGCYKLSHNNYHVHICLMEYDDKLPYYFTNNHRFLWNRMNKQVLNDSKYFEKQQLKWFSTNELRTLRHEFRGFYREIVDVIVKELSKIRVFLRNRRRGSRKSISKSKRSTRKYRGG